MLALGSALASCGYDGERPIRVVTSCQLSFLVLMDARNGTGPVDAAEAERDTLKKCESPELWLDTAADNREQLEGVEPDVALDSWCLEADRAAALPACERAAEES